MTKNAQYPLEAKAEELLDRASLLLEKAAKFFFVIPRSKMDKVIYAIETTSWIMLGVALILRWGKF